MGNAPGSPVSTTLSPVGVTILSVVANVVLAAGKMVAGVVCNSQAIFVEGLHTASDLVTDLAVLAGLRVSGRPADESHPYGHHRATTIVTLLLALTLMGVAAYVAYGSIRSFVEAAPRPVRPLLPLALALVTIAVKEAMYRLTVRVGQRARDSSLVANAWHHRTDAIAAVAAAVGLAGVAIGGPKWHFLDHLTALILVSFLGMVGWRIIRQAGEELMDRAPSRQVQAVIQRTVAGTPGVQGFHAFRARQLGGRLEMDVHVQVDPHLTVRQGHDIARNVRDQVMQADPSVVSVIVHVEPKEQT